MSLKGNFSMFETNQDENLVEGDVIMTNLEVEARVRWSDKIVVDADPETGMVEYESGWVLDILPINGNPLAPNAKYHFLYHTKNEHETD